MSKKGNIDVKSSLSSSSYGKLFSGKGQITIFIILGILLLLVAALLILLQQEIISFQIEELIPTESGKVEIFITDCIQSVGEDALDLAGLQGGYIEVPERYSGDLNWHIAQSPFIDTPLWAYGANIDRPSLDTIKEDVDNYIEENVRDCLFDSKAFQETYDLVEASSIESDVEFLDSKTNFNVRWNILVKDKYGEVVAELIEHMAESNVKFKSMYEMADAILNAEMDELKLEDITQDLIALEHDDLPVNGIELSCTPKTWRVDVAKQTLKDMLRVNLRELKISGSDYVEFPKELPYYENHYVWDIEHEDEDMSVVFKFEDNNWFNFQVTPASGNIMKSDQLGGVDLLSFLCIQNWKFTYDVVYPVIVEIRDQTSGASFQIGLSVHLLENYPNKGDLVARESFFSGTTDDEEFCLYSPSTVEMDVLTYSLVENPITGVYSREPLDEVNVSYTCIKYRCEIGQSEYNFQALGDVAGLSAEFPYCAAAIMRGNKDGYQDTWEYVVTEDGAQVELNLRPLYQFNLADVSVVKHKIVGRECSDEEEKALEDAGEEPLCYDLSDGEELNEDETAMVTLKYLEVNLTELEDFNQLEEGEAQDNESVEGIDTEQVSGLTSLVLNDGEEIQKTEFIYSPGFTDEFLVDSYVEILGEAEFDYQVQIYLVDEEELIGAYRGVWETPWESLVEGSKVTFHVLEMDPGDEEYYYAFMADLEKYSDLIPTPEVEVRE